MESKFDLDWIETCLNDTVGWFCDNIITWNALAQLGVVIVSLSVAYFFSAKSALWLKRKLRNRRNQTIFRLHTSAREMFFLLYVVTFAWCAVVVVQGTKQPYHLLKTAASLATAWAVIRLTSSTIKSKFWSRFTAITLLIIATLNILGILEQTIILLNEPSLTIGKFQLTLLLVIKSLLAFAVLLWIIKLLTSLLERSFSKAQGITPSQRVLFQKLSTIALYTTGAIIGLNIVGLDLTTLAAFSGALGLGIGFGLQKVFSNLISGIILLVDKSVKPGDVIAIGNTYGWGEFIRCPLRFGFNA